MNKDSGSVISPMDQFGLEYSNGSFWPIALKNSLDLPGRQEIAVARLFRNANNERSSSGWAIHTPKMRRTLLIKEFSTQSAVPGRKMNSAKASIQFTGWRRIHLLKSLRCCYVDIDGNTNLDIVLDTLRELAYRPMATRH